jgi:hypothetical protein
MQPDEIKYPHTPAQRLIAQLAGRPEPGLIAVFKVLPQRTPILGVEQRTNRLWPKYYRRQFG